MSNQLFNKTLKDKKPRLRTGEYKRAYKCLTHPERSVRYRPPDSCVTCWGNYEKVKLKSRQTMFENNSGKFGDPHGGRGICGVCQRKQARLQDRVLSTGEKICETCCETFDSADSIAANTNYIHRDMAEYDMMVRLDKGYTKLEHDKYGWKED
jgi:hypothetical protein